ncbi:MAG TPA: ABC transporter ATP-binding protein [Ktedonobacterales bacterium]|nr:ABC transporter ATP-binding protein [Ktedonobacterales bacterium]
MAAPDIECRDLCKAYTGPVVALADVTLSIERGMSFGLLGENGAGKSTLVRILMGFIRPTSGSVRVLGSARLARIHAEIGYVHERPTFEARFTGREHLRYLAELSGLTSNETSRRVNTVLDMVNLSGAAARRVAGYSKGMLQRLAIAQALLTDPTLLILDEPTSGLDPLAQWEVRRIIAALHDAGKTILLCSHYLAEVEALCDTVGILRKGRLARFGAVNELRGLATMVEIRVAGEYTAARACILCGLAPEEVEARDDTLRVPASEQARVLGALVRAEIPIHSLTPMSRTLEEVYVRVAAAAGPDHTARHDATLQHSAPMGARERGAP